MLQNKTQLRQVQSTRVFQPCECIQNVMITKRRQIKSTIVWGIIALFSVLLLDLLNLSIQYETFEKSVLFVLIIKLSLLVGFLIIWYSKKYQTMASNHRKAMLFTYCISFSVTLIEEMIIKSDQMNERNIIVIGMLQICMVVVIFWQIINQNKLSMIALSVIGGYIIGRFFDYLNSNIQEIVFMVCQFLILTIYSINRIYFDMPLTNIKIEVCHLLNSPQTALNNHNISHFQQGQQSHLKQNNNETLNETTNYQNGHLNPNNRQHNYTNSNQMYNQSSNQYIINNNHTDQYALRDISDTKNKGLSFSFDIASREPGTPNQPQFNQAPMMQQINKSPLNISLQCDKDSELGQKSTNNSQKLQNIRSNLENSQGHLYQAQPMQRGGSFLNESGNFLKASGQVSLMNDSHQWNNINNESMQQMNKYQFKAHPIGPISNQQTPIYSGSPTSNQALNENFQNFGQRVSGSQQQVESYKNISLAQIEMTNSKKMLNGKSVNSETVNLVNFYNMFFNILPEGIAIIPLINFPDKLDGCQINQTLSSLLECDNKEQCIQMLTELRNSKIEEQLAQMNSNMNMSNLNASALHLGSNSDFITQMRSDSVISTMSAVNQTSDTGKNKKKTQQQIISTQSLKEEIPVMFQDTISYDETKENYINEKTRRITFIVDYNNVKKNKHLESHSDIVGSEKKQNNNGANNEQKNNRFYSSANQESNKNYQNLGESSNLKGLPLLKPSNYQVQVNPSTKMTVMKEIEHIRKQIQNLKFFDSYEMIGVHVRMVSKCKLQNDKTKYFEIIFIPCIVKSEITVVLVIKDITHFNEIEVLKMVNENKSQMLSQVAHEIRTPLNCVISMIEITKDLTDTSICENYLAPALTSARLLNNLIQDLLDMAQVKAGCFQLKSTKFNIRNLLEEIKQLMKIQAQTSNIQMQVQISEQVPTSIYSDPFRIRQILINLIGNALKFTQKGFITVVAERYVHQNIDTIVKISVRDTGIGIKPKQKQKLFQAFGKLDDDNQEYLNPKGVGLGLMISNELAKKLSNPVFTNQGLEVSSVYGQGSEFSFFIIDNVQLQASVLHISQKQIQIHDQKTEKTGVSKKRVNSSSLHRIDEEEREIKSQNDVLVEQNGYISRNHAPSIQNTLPSNINFIYSTNTNTLSNNPNIQLPSSAISTQHYELYPIQQGYNENKLYSPLQKEIHSFNNSSNHSGYNSGGQTNNQYTATTYNNNNNHNKGNCSINSFDHNIEDEESVAEPVHAQKYRKQAVGIGHIAPHLKDLNHQDSYSSAQTDQNTTNQDIPHQYEFQQQHHYNNNSQIQFHRQVYHTSSLQNVNQNSPLPQSPSRYSNISTPNQIKRMSLQKNIFMQKFEESDNPFGYVANPLLETREIQSTHTQNEDVFTMPSKTEKAFCGCNKILIVDDNTFNVYALKQLIKTLKQYDCDTALSGEQSIELIQEKLTNNCCQKYKIIFMDIDMPSKNGLQTTAIIRKNFYTNRDTKIIGCSGYSNSSQEYQNCIEAGMNDYLSKPIDKTHLKQILETYM